MSLKATPPLQRLLKKPLITVGEMSGFRSGRCHQNTDSSRERTLLHLQDQNYWTNSWYFVHYYKGGKVKILCRKSCRLWPYWILKKSFITVGETSKIHPILARFQSRRRNQNTHFVQMFMSNPFSQFLFASVWLNLLKFFIPMLIR